MRSYRSIYLLYCCYPLPHPLAALFSTVIDAFDFVCFIGGMGLYLYRDKIRLDYRIALLLVFIWALSFHTAYGLYVSSLVLPYLVIYFAFIRTPPLHKLAKYGDFSYGLFIYAFPLQQLIVYFLVDMLTPARLFGISIIAISCCYTVMVFGWVSRTEVKITREASTRCA